MGLVDMYTLALVSLVANTSTSASVLITANPFVFCGTLLINATHGLHA